MILRYYRNLSSERLEKDRRSTFMLMIVSFLVFVSCVLANNAIWVVAGIFLFTLLMVLWFTIVQREHKRRLRDDSTRGPQRTS